MPLPQALTYFMVTIACTLIAGIVYDRTSYEMGTELQVKSYKGLIGCYLVFVVSNGICLWANYANENNLGYIATLVNLSSLCACAFFWYRFIEAKLGIHQHRRFVNILITLPLILVILFVSTSMFTELVYYYKSDGSFARGPLWIFLLLVPVCYILYAGGHIISRFFSTQSPSRRKEYKYLMSFAFLPLVAGLMDMFVPHLPVMELSIMICIVLFYIAFQDKLIYVDALTGMNNRRVSDKYLRSQLSLAAPDNPLIFFLADCDDFKIINDKYGHLEGDRALKIVGNELEKLSIRFNCYVARWGGDEFVLIARKNSIPEPEALINLFYTNLQNRIKDEGIEYDIHISLGYVPCYDAKASTIDIFGEAEKKMYQAKENNKNARAGSI